MPGHHHRRRVVPIGWRAIVVGQEMPEIFEKTIKNLSQGWKVSASEEVEFPIDIVLGLEREAKLTRLEITVLKWMAPHRIDVKLGQGRAFLPLDYKMAKAAKYIPAGSIHFDTTGEEGKYRRGQLEFGRIGRNTRRFQFIWLILHGPTADGQEQKDRIGMTELKIFGLEVPKMDWTKRRRMQKLYGFEAKSSSSEGEKDEDEEEDEDEEGKMHLGRPTNGYGLAEFDRIEEDLERKRLNAGKDQKPILKMAIQRALGELHVCQERVTNLRAKRTLAMVEGKLREAEQLQTMLNQTMENFCRANQIDLLMDKK